MRRVAWFVLLAALEALAIVALVIAAALYIPHVAPLPAPPTPTIPVEALLDCPRTLLPCR